MGYWLNQKPERHKVHYAENGIMNSELSKLSPQKMTETIDFAHI
jgi:hypothetical protein